MPSPYIPMASVQTAAKSTVASVFEAMVRLYPERPALQDDQHQLTYHELGEQIKRIASWLAATGLERGDRVALLSENSIVYLEIMLAAAAQGYILACQNWRLLPHELQHCLRLVTPKLVLTSERFGDTLRNLDCGDCQTRILSADLAREWRAMPPVEPNRAVDPDEDDQEVPVGIPGEVAVRGPTLFSGYWQAEEVNAQDFCNGWFHMGDILVRHADGTFEFVDRAKYLIKSGGENIYPAEIEAVLLSESRVVEAAVVRQADPHWGEVPIAFVARSDDSLTEVDLYRLCRKRLAGYKQPKGIHFIAVDSFPRSASGKVQRHELQARLEKES